MSLLPIDASAPGSALPADAPAVGAPIDGWARRWQRLSRPFGRPHLLFVQPDRVWHWDARLGDTPYAGRERRAARVPRRHDSVPAWCNAHPGSAARLVLSGRLTHHVLVRDRTLPLFEPADVERYARQQFVHYHGQAAQHWPLAVWLEGAQRGASALHGLDLPEVLREAERCDVRLRAAEPAWAAAFRFALRQLPSLLDEACAAVALVEGVHVTWLVCERGELVSLRQRLLASPERGALETLIGELRGDGSDMPSVHVLGYGIDPGSAQADGRPLRGANVLGVLGSEHPSAHWLPP